MIATSRSAAALVTAWFAFIVCGFGQVAPMPARGHPRLPGPATDGYIEQAPADRIQAHLATVAAWEPLTGQTRHGDIQAAVIITLGVEPRTINKLDAWMSSWDISRGIWPRCWAEDAAALAAAWIYDQCHSRAPPEMRQRWLRQCVLSLARLRAVWIQQRYSVFNSVTYNRAGAAPVWLALAAWPDAAPEFGTELFDWAVSVAAEYVEAWRLMLDGGGWPEGWTYWGQGGRAVYQVLAGIDADLRMGCGGGQAHNHRREHGEPACGLLGIARLDVTHDSLLNGSSIEWALSGRRGGWLWLMFGSTTVKAPSQQAGTVPVGACFRLLASQSDRLAAHRTHWDLGPLRSFVESSLSLTTSDWRMRLSSGEVMRCSSAK